jgi:hypothetical protein
MSFQAKAGLRMTVIKQEPSEQKFTRLLQDVVEDETEVDISAEKLTDPLDLELRQPDNVSSMKWWSAGVCVLFFFKFITILGCAAVMGVLSVCGSNRTGHIAATGLLMLVICGVAFVVILAKRKADSWVKLAIVISIGGSILVNMLSVTYLITETLYIAPAQGMHLVPANSTTELSTTPVQNATSFPNVRTFTDMTSLARDYFKPSHQCCFYLEVGTAVMWGLHLIFDIIMALLIRKGQFQNRDETMF